MNNVNEYVPTIFAMIDDLDLITMSIINCCGYVDDLVETQ
jgi:hypothetical protein